MGFDELIRSSMTNPFPRCRIRSDAAGICLRSAAARLASCAELDLRSSMRLASLVT